MSESFKWRVIEPWSEPDGINVFSSTKSFLTWKEMQNPVPGTRTVQFVEDCIRWGYNAISIYMDPEDNPEAVRVFAKYLRGKGLGLIVRRDWYELEGKKSWPAQREPELWAVKRHSRKLCPYQPETREYWKQRIAGDFQRIPDLLGYRMNGTGYVFINGTPWMCDCEVCGRHTERERARDAIRLVADLLAEHDGVLFWETCQDDPGGQYEEAMYFDGMSGEIPENARIVMKLYYWDYHPGYPRHPLFDTIATDEKGESPYMTSIQLAGEYRGVHDFPWAMLGEWSAVMRDMVRTEQTGLWVMAIVHYDDWDHPLNMINWYAISRFIRDPLADPNRIALDWARESFGAEAAPSVVEVVDKMRRAAQGVFEFGGLWTQLHSRYPTLTYLDSRLCGPCRQSPRRQGMMGQTWPLGMYSAERQTEIRANPRTRLIFTPQPITRELKAEMMSEKEEAVKLATEATALWRSLEGKIERSLHEKVLGLLRGNIDDAILWSMGMDMYMDMKLGTLTEDRIDAVLAECDARDLKGTIVDDPLAASPVKTDFYHVPSSLKLFAEELRQELRNPHLDSMSSEHGGVDLK